MTIQHMPFTARDLPAVALYLAVYLAASIIYGLCYVTDTIRAHWVTVLVCAFALYLFVASLARMM